MSCGLADLFTACRVGRWTYRFVCFCDLSRPWLDNYSGDHGKYRVKQGPPDERDEKLEAVRD